jgi:hypothetical protein
VNPIRVGPNTRSSRYRACPFWPIFAVAFFGSMTLGSISRVRVAIQFTIWIALTVPTLTSATRTWLLTLSVNVSGICA